MWVRLDVRQNIDLVYCAFFQLLIFFEFIDWNDFNSILFFIAVVNSAINLAIDA
jgi:hypothetical protein